MQNPVASPLSLDVSNGSELTNTQLMEMALTHESLWKRRSAIILLGTRKFAEGMKAANAVHSHVVDQAIKRDRVRA